MKSNFHPSEFTNYFSNRLAFKVACSALALTGCLTYLTSYYTTDLLSLWLIGNACANLLLSRFLQQSVNRNKRLLKAFEVISNNAIENRLYNAMLPSAEDIKPIDIVPRRIEPDKENVASAIINHDGHTAIVAKTRSGKTTLILQAVQIAQRNGRRIIIIDGKGDRRLADCEGVTYLAPNQPEKVGAAITQLDQLVSQMFGMESDVFPINVLVVIDEINCLRINAELSGKRQLQMLDRLVTLLLLQGASKKLNLLVTAHTSRVEDWGLNSGILDSLSFLAMGRNNAFESIEDAIRYQVSPNQKRIFQDELEQVRIGFNSSIPLVLSSLNGWHFCQPELSTITETERGQVFVPGGENPDSFVGTTIPEMQKGKNPESLPDNDFPLFPLSAKGSQMLGFLGFCLKTKGKVSAEDIQVYLSSQKQYSGFRRFLDLLTEE